LLGLHIWKPRKQVRRMSGSDQGRGNAKGIRGKEVMLEE
jgi:hypothetical protein